MTTMNMITGPMLTVTKIRMTRMIIIRETGAGIWPVEDSDAVDEDLPRFCSNAMAILSSVQLLS